MPRAFCVEVVLVVSVTEYFKSFISVVRRILFTSRALCHKVRYLARGCSSCTLLISKKRLMNTASTITLCRWYAVEWDDVDDSLYYNNQQTHRCRALSLRWYADCCWETWILAVSQISITGCRHTASSKIQRRQNSCGRVPSTVWVNSMVVARQSSLALTPLSPMDTYTVRVLGDVVWFESWENMSQPSVLPASFISDRFVVSGSR